MHMKEIEVGEEYAVGGRRAIVLDKSLAHSSGRRNGVRVRYVEGHGHYAGKTEEVVLSRNVTRTWVEHVQSMERDRRCFEAHKRFVSDLSALKDEVIDQLAAVGVETAGVVVRDFGSRSQRPPLTSLTLEPEMLAKLSEVLTTVAAVGEDERAGGAGVLSELFS